MWKFLLFWCEFKYFCLYNLKLSFFLNFDLSHNMSNTKTKQKTLHVSSPYFKQLILGLWLDFCFTNFLDFNCDGYYDGALSARARGFTFCVHFY